ncbi:Transient receptor potential cation channel subfamily V member 4 [Trichinella nativa]|uniref:Transient receptor potential cation channel subfamily V member 4 n=1 Tax=Trichinella nativa TaxID=6335 RepID=A0A0V1LR03_9BILA|nr:Transient receptor potential cation channel subfamily V member 4 [Trichinella nativa]
MHCVQLSRPSNTSSGQLENFSFSKFKAAESDASKQSTSTSPPPPPPALVAPPLVCWCQSSSPSDIDQVIPIWVGKCSRTKVPATSAYRFFWKRYHDRKPADPDSKWTNLSREYERNNIYKWLQRKKPGSLIEIYEQEGRDGVLRFAEEKIVPMLHNEGQHPEIVREIDYIKWRKFMSTNLNENAEKEDKDQEIMQSIQFQEHQALWRLNRRGVKGETLAHLLLSSNEQRSAEIARILICEYPHLSLDIYEDEEMYGQSCLHLAILHNDYDTACLLLQCGASAVQRATGRFFWPNENGTSAAKESTQYEGLAYFGEYPLAFAASFGNKDIYDALIDFNADPNAQDTYGNTVLHMCVIHNSIPADTTIVNGSGCTPLSLATRLGRKEIFEEMLELSGVEFWRFSDITVSAYPLAALDTINADGSTNWDSALMNIIQGNTADHTEMVQGDVVQRLLADKWRNFGWRHLFRWAIMFVLHLCSLSAAIYLRPTDGRFFDYSGIYGICRAVAEATTVTGSLVFIFYQCFAEMLMQGFNYYLLAFRNSFVKIVFLIENVLVILCIPCRVLGYVNVEEVLLVLVAPSSWMMLLYFARASILTGPFVHIIYSMITGDMMRFALLSSVFLLSFGLVFNVLGQNMIELQELNYCSISGREKKSSYTTYGETILTLFRAAMGGYEYEQLECSYYSVLLKILFICYLVVMPIMLINMLLAMMGNTYTTIISQAEKAWRFQLAEMVIRLERYYSKEKLAQFQLNYSIKMGEDRDTGMEKRGLMVIKQFRKTRAQQRKLALTNWKNLYRKYMDYRKEYGVEKARNIIWHGNWANNSDWRKKGPVGQKSESTEMVLSTKGCEISRAGSKEKLISNHVSSCDQKSKEEEEEAEEEAEENHKTEQQQEQHRAVSMYESAKIDQIPQPPSFAKNNNKREEMNSMETRLSEKWNYILTQSQLVAKEQQQQQNSRRGRWTRPSNLSTTSLQNDQPKEKPIYAQRRSIYFTNIFKSQKESNNVSTELKTNPPSSSTNLPV